MSRRVWYAVAVIIGLILAVLIAVTFDSPTSVWLLLVLVAIGVALTFVGRRKGRVD